MTPLGVLQAGVGRAFPGAVAVALHHGRVLFEEAVGTIDYHAPARCTTAYDLASLTKPLATWSVLVDALDRGQVQLDQQVAAILNAPTLVGITVRHLAGHTSGLAAWRALDPDRPRADVLHTPPGCPPGLRAVYSDLGYMALGWFLEAVLGAPLDQLVARNRGRFCLGSISFSAPEGVAPTEMGVPIGVVHDSNARLLGGVAGHAGLFGTAMDVACFGHALLGLRVGPLGPLIDRLWYSGPACSASTTWRLGFDTVTPGGSSAGHHFSPRAVGHLGYTGTSLWIDPERALVVVLLSNRVHPNDLPNPEIRRLRPAFHDALIRTSFLNRS
ncbi:MAG: CubicO group peptidase (beta-lactamase class C family) [Myxococcota bacterium]|jgi:CubicO group peptidase (beta-lactamase class C family)